MSWLTNLWNTIVSWFKKVTPTPSPIPLPIPSPAPAPAGCGCNLSLPVCDPDPSKYTQDYMDANGSFEECGIEAQMKIISRFCVVRGNSGGFWMLSSLGMPQVSRAPDGTGAYKCFTTNGYRYHIKGYVGDEPQQNAVESVTVSTSGKYAIAEPRQVTS